MRLYKRVPDTDERGHTVVHELATDSEIAAAHPKCATCRHFILGDSWEGDNCMLVGYFRQKTDYCPHHTELTGESDESV